CRINCVFSALQDFKMQMIEEMKTTRNEINILAESVQFMSNKMDESTNLMKTIKEELAVIKKENEHLTAMNRTLNTEVTSLKNRVRALEQYSRKNIVEVNGIPETPREDVVGLVRDVGAALVVEIQESDISTAHRVPSLLPVLSKYKKAVSHRGHTIFFKRSVSIVLNGVIHTDLAEPHRRICGIAPRAIFSKHLSTSVASRMRRPVAQFRAVTLYKKLD
ncbi:hypothetical protein J6590_101870, partial [Homalodisca vitripennis]